jgi:DNA-directed RNA polymerase subunit M/transcription elongation factor TFIIS
MPAYNMLCPECGMDKDEFVPYTTFCEHNTRETAITCPKCGKETAFYSLTHLKENLRLQESDILNFYGPGEQEKWFRNLEGLGKR